MDISAAFKAAPVYAIYDTQVGSHLSAQAVVEGWLRAGVRVIQYRHKGTPEAGRLRDLVEVARAVREADGIFVVNDRADLVLLVRAQGVHLGQQDLPPANARGLLPEPNIIGYSTHNSAQLMATRSMPIDYVAVGPIFSTSSKANPDPVVGLNFVAEARQLTELPLVAIGGITRANIGSILAAGADAAAVINDLIRGCLSVEDVENRARQILELATSEQSPKPAAL